MPIITARPHRGLPLPNKLLDYALGYYSAVAHLPSELVAWAPAALLGGGLGARYGSTRLPAPVIVRLLAAVLGVAGLKMLLRV